MFRETVTSADGSTEEGTCSDAYALQVLSRAVRLGYRVEATRQGGAVVVREIPSGEDRWRPPRKHTVMLEPAAQVGKVTDTNRLDLRIIDQHAGRSLAARLNPATGRIDSGVNSIPPAAAARLIERGLVVVDGMAVSVSLAARLAMLAQDHHTETQKPRGYYRKAGVIGPWRKGGCVYDRSSVAHCTCHWSYPAEDRDDARRLAHGHRQEATAAMLRALNDAATA